MKTETWYAYLAGLFDGEGSLYISFHVSRNEKWGEHLDVKPVVQLTFAYSEEKEKLLKAIHEEFGGHLGIYDKNDRGKMRKIIQWQLVKLENVKAFLTAILPHLRIKRREAELILEAVKIMEQHYHSSAPRPPEFLIRIAEISDELSKLGSKKGRRKWNYQRVVAFIEHYRDIYVHHRRKYLSKEHVRQIIELYKQGLSYSEIAKRVNISKSTVARVIWIYTGKSREKAINVRAYLQELGFTR